jgi:hypothetical protein
MDGTLAIKIFAAVFVLLSLGIPAYLYATKPKIKTGYRSRSGKRRQRILVSAFITLVALIVLIMVLALTANKISDLVGG